MTVLDQTSDTSGRETNRIFQVYSPPQYVKAAAVSTRCGGDDRDFNKFADTQRRLYPCHNAAAVWVSSAFWFDKQAGVQSEAQDPIETRLLKAARFFGIEADVLAVKAAADRSHDETTKLADDAFAFVWVDENGGKQRKLPLRNGVEVKVASEWFSKNRDHFVVNDQQVISRRILEKAATFGAAIDSDTEQTLNRSAGFGMCSQNRTRDFLLKRASQYPAKEATEALSELAERCYRNPDLLRDPSTRSKVASVVDQLDRKFGLVKRYDQDVERPVDRLFEVTEQLAKQASSKLVRLTSGSVYHDDDLAGVKLADVRDYLGQDLAQAISSDGLLVDVRKAAAVLPTLPRNDAELFDQMVGEHQIQPVMKTAGDRKWLTRDEVLQLMTR